MAQEIKIPVSAKTGDADRELGKLEQTADGIAAAVRKIDAASKGAARGLGDVEAAARKLEQTRGALSRHFGKDISPEDASQFESNFDAMKRGRTRDARMIKPFSSPGDWWNGHSGMFTKEAHAARHRRAVMSAGMQGTTYASRFGAPPPPDEGGEGGGGGRGGSLAMGLAKGGLALAGIGSLFSMAQSALRNGTEEAYGLDSLKRRMGDGSVDYKVLQAITRTAGARVGVNFVESQGYASRYASESGFFRAGALNGNQFGKGLETGMGLGRSYGLDPGAGVDFLGTMRRTGVVSDDQSNRRVALMIADAIQKGGYIAKADEVMKAVADFSNVAARMTLSVPNVGAYAAGMASLMGSGVSGLDPAGASAIINAADQTLRRGGGMGEASLNFNYMALSKMDPGLNVVTAKAMMQGGLFGTGNDFYDTKNSALARYYQSRGLKRPGRGQWTNFDRIMGQMKQNYHGEMLLDAVQNHFGLSSYGQAAGLIEMNDKGLVASSAQMLARRGVKLEDISPTGLQSVAAIAGARSMGDMQAVYQGIMGRSDVPEAVKRHMALGAQTAARGGDLEGMRGVLLDAVGKSDQEKTPATETRDSLKVIADALTGAGGPILSVLNPMRIALDWIAKHFGAGEDYQRQIDAVNGRTLNNDVDPISPSAGIPIDWGRTGSGAPSGGRGTGGGGEAFKARAMKFFMARGVAKDDAAAIVGNLYAESGGNSAISGDSGLAYGLGGWHPDRQRNFKRWSGYDMHGSSEEAQLGFVMHEMATTHSRAWQKMRAAKTLYGKVGAVGRFYEAPGGSTFDSYNLMNGWGNRLGAATEAFNAPLPAGDPAHQAAAARTSLHVNFAEAVVTLTDKEGANRGRAILKPVSKAVPAGGDPGVISSMAAQMGMAGG